MVNSYIVYKHTCPNGKVYIGITNQTPSKRWRNGKGYHHNAHFTSAIKKYGWQNIKHEILFDSLTEAQACEKEIALIAEYKSNQREYGYNQSCGGEEHKGCKCSEQTKQAISAANKGRVAYNKGVPMSKEQKQKVSKSRKGKMTGKQNHNSKNIYQLSLNGEVIKEWDSACMAGRELGVDYKSICACCVGKQKTAYGYKWARQIAETKDW